MKRKTKIIVFCTILALCVSLVSISAFAWGVEETFVIDNVMTCHPIVFSYLQSGYSDGQSGTYLYSQPVTVDFTTPYQYTAFNSNEPVLILEGGEDDYGTYVINPSALPYKNGDVTITSRVLQYDFSLYYEWSNPSPDDILVALRDDHFYESSNYNYSRGKIYGEAILYLCTNSGYYRYVNNFLGGTYSDLEISLYSFGIDDTSDLGIISFGIEGRVWANPGEDNYEHAAKFYCDTSYSDTCDDLRNAYNFKDTYTNGYSNGYDEGRIDGENAGYNSGYNEGYYKAESTLNPVIDELQEKYDNAKEGLDNSNAVLNFFQGILEAVQGTLNTFFNLEVFGFNLGNIVAILLGALVVIIVIKFII